MTNDELTTKLSALPGSLLRRLAKGHVTRHFRVGKTRLIQAILDLSPEQRAHVVTELAAIRYEQAAAQDDDGATAQPDGTTAQPDGATARPDNATPHSDDATARRPGAGRRGRRGRGGTDRGAPASRAAPMRRPNVNPPPRVVPAQPRPAPSTEPDVTTDALFEGIGVPPQKPFIPDAWQREAVDHLADSDVILSVPTGSGKTYVAIEAMRRAIAAKKTVIYTSPLKALSNTKLTEFGQIFGTDNVGILTGDRRDNPHAPVLIMTTEILRNLLYDAAAGEIDMRLDSLGLVILDESQFIADPERGVVWEETIIFCPSQSRLLLLSASIGNPDEVASWIGSIRSTPCRLIHHRNRSVPLRAAYLDPGGTLTPLLRTRDIVRDKHPELHPDAVRLFAQYEAQTTGPRSRR